MSLLEKGVPTSLANTSVMQVRSKRLREIRERRRRMAHRKNEGSER